MNIETKFSIGDDIFFVATKTKDLFCPMCEQKHGTTNEYYIKEGKVKLITIENRFNKISIIYELGFEYEQSIKADEERIFSSKIMAGKKAKSLREAEEIRIGVLRNNYLKVQKND